MDEKDIVAGFNEWMRQYAANPKTFASLEKLAEQKRNGGAVTYGDKALATLTRCAKDAARQS